MLTATSMGSQSSTHGADNPNQCTQDNVIPRHLIQNTYNQLHIKYAHDLYEWWVEETEPSNKHISESLTIAAFLIELWRTMYGACPSLEQTSTPEKEEHIQAQNFPGFVDLACGNGVLVYVLLVEGYAGCGFDARRRKSWTLFPDWVQERLQEAVFVPHPFMEVFRASPLSREIGTDVHPGDFSKDTFLISSHADELTVWTPLMAALACPMSPLPFLVIPCCSHALSGSRYRYPPPKRESQTAKNGKSGSVEANEFLPRLLGQDSQPAAGDLRALRADKTVEKTMDGMPSSMYGSLTAKTMSVAEEIGYAVEQNLLPIPSTRNMGIAANRQQVTRQWRERTQQTNMEKSAYTGVDAVVQAVNAVVERECSQDGGVEAAAKIWIEHTRGLLQDQGMANRAH
ncbi:tRNA(Ser) Um(44) 2'-O-methyltransferase [Penicillium alfredii]|uniref:tRNA (uracil-O(2)-)-methyltransferase n=1 Tax=Penicillium alfredii TaxID=1506179 RepID=A0A9W9F2N4_9EURO|nr:tRNA(Ser) Um(44) 2'-O-methyltransferase [Penicillium alfredii]KAJ5092538.1 tRNA(Ser) Um(44) 2'-O-methyltransferase [Penicillium alfredii]